MNSYRLVQEIQSTDGRSTCPGIMQFGARSAETVGLQNIAHLSICLVHRCFEPFSKNSILQIGSSRREFTRQSGASASVPGSRSASGGGCRPGSVRIHVANILHLSAAATELVAPRNRGGARRECLIVSGRELPSPRAGTAAGRTAANIGPLHR